MASKSNIEWTDASWTPIRARNLKTGKVGWHCEHATTGCEFCYSEGFNLRLGTGLPFKPGHRKDIELFLDEEMLRAPLRWKKPRMIFVCSMTDAFADFVKDEWLDRMFAVMALCPQHTFQVLTKRAERMREYCSMWAVQADLPHEGLGYSGAFITADWPLPNVWLGVSAERQQEADERIPHLLNTPAAVRFVSAEPLLGPIDFTQIATMDSGFGPGCYSINALTLTWNDMRGLDWIIVGGESGHGAREHDLAWSRPIIAQCRAAGVAVFEKQLGSAPYSAADRISYKGRNAPHPHQGFWRYLNERKGGDWNEWPEDLRVREFPEVRT